MLVRHRGGAVVFQTDHDADGVMPILVQKSKGSNRTVAWKKLNAYLALTWLHDLKQPQGDRERALWLPMDDRSYDRSQVRVSAASVELPDR